MKKAMLVVLVLGLAMPALADLRVEQYQTNLFDAGSLDLRDTGEEIYSNVGAVSAGAAAEVGEWIFDDLMLDYSLSTGTVLDSARFTIWNSHADQPIINADVEVAFYTAAPVADGYVAPVDFLGGFNFDTLSAFGSNFDLQPGGYSTITFNGISSLGIDTLGAERIWAGLRVTSLEEGYGAPGQVGGAAPTIGTSEDYFFRAGGSGGNGFSWWGGGPTNPWGNLRWELTTPEPMTCALLAVGGLVLLRRR